MTIQKSQRGRPITWLALGSALALSVLCLYMPYQLYALPQQYVYPFLRLFGLGFSTAAVLLVLDLARVGTRVCCGWLGRALLSLILIVWAVCVAFLPGVVTGQYAYSLIAAALVTTLIWPDQEDRIFWVLSGLLPLGLGAIILLWPERFASIIYGMLRPGLPWLMLAGGAAFLLTPALAGRLPWWKLLSHTLVAAGLVWFGLSWALVQNLLGAVNYLTLGSVYGLRSLRDLAPASHGSSPLRRRLSLLVLAVSALPLFLAGAGAVLALEVVEQRKVEAILSLIALQYDRDLNEGVQVFSGTLPEETGITLVPLAVLPDEWQASLGVGTAHGYSQNGRRYMAAYLRRPDSQQTIVVTRPWTRVFDHTSAVGVMVLLGTALIIGVTQAIAQTWASRLVRRLGALDQAAQSVSERDYTVRIDRGLEAGDEIARVALSVNQMATALQEYDVQTKRYTRELLERNQEITEILENSFDGFFYLDREWRFVYVNEIAGRLLQRLPREMVGQSIWALHPEAVGSEFWHQYRRALEERVRVQFEAYYPPLDIWVKVHAVPSEPGLAVYFVDITDLKKAQIQLQERMEELDLERRLLRTVLEVLPAGVAIMDAQRRRVLVNRTFGQIWGDADIVTSPSPYRKFRGRWRATGEPVATEDWAMARALRGEVTLNQEVEIEGFDGVRRTILNSAVPVRDECGGIRNGVVVAVDITALVRLEEDLRRSADRFAEQAAVLERIASGAPLEGTLMELARLVERQTGICACAIMLLDDTGQGWLQVISPARPPDFWMETPESDPGFLTRTFTGADGMKAGEVRVALAADGVDLEAPAALVQMAAHIAGIALARHQGLEAPTRKLVALIQHLTEGVIAMDASRSVLFMNRSAGNLLGTGVITAPTPLSESGLPEPLQAMLEQISLPGTYASQTRVFQWNETEVEAEVLPVYSDLGRYGVLAVLRNVSERTRFVRLQQSFIANVSHELRGPLAAVSATLEAIADGVIPERERPRYLSAVLGEMARMRRLSYDVVDLTQLDSGLVVLNPQPFDLGELFESARDRYASRCQAAGVHLLVQAEPVTVWADRDRVDQVLVNLIENAIRFTPAGGRVQLSAEADGASIRVLVRDTGKGIPAQHVAQIWERFYKVDRARTLYPNSGSGLGLAIVKQLVELMGGEVAAESEPGEGSTFAFTLPAGAGRD